MTTDEQDDGVRGEDDYVPYEQAIAEAGQVIAEGLMRQAALTPRDAALASLGRRASEEEIAAWISRNRPPKGVKPPS
jgi:hypothetical protein